MMRCDGKVRDALRYILGTLTGGTVPGTQTAQMHRSYIAPPLASCYWLMICSGNTRNETQTRSGDNAEEWMRDIVMGETYRVKDERSGAKDEGAVTGVVRGGTSHLYEVAATDEIISLYCMYIYVNQSRNLPNHAHHSHTHEPYHDAVDSNNP